MSTLFMPGRASVASTALRSTRRRRPLRSLDDHDRRVLAALDRGRSDRLRFTRSTG